VDPDPTEQVSLESMALGLSQNSGRGCGFLSVYTRAFLFYGKVNKM